MYKIIWKNRKVYGIYETREEAEKNLPNTEDFEIVQVPR